MRVIHSLAQFLRDASQAGQAVPGTSPSDADGGGQRQEEEGGSHGEFQTVLLVSSLCPGFSPSLGQGLPGQAQEDSKLNVYSMDLFKDSNSLTI